MGVLMMNTSQRGRGSKYTDAFKRQLVLESRVDGVSVPMVSKRHGVPTNRIYAWRGDARFQPGGSAGDVFTPVEVSDVVAVDTPAQPSCATLPTPRIEITLENGRRLSVSDVVDAGFVLELARGLAA
jgi:transposase